MYTLIVGTFTVPIEFQFVEILENEKNHFEMEEPSDNYPPSNFAKSDEPKDEKYQVMPPTYKVCVDLGMRKRKKLNIINQIKKNKLFL